MPKRIAWHDRQAYTLKTEHQEQEGRLGSHRVSWLLSYFLFKIANKLAKIAKNCLLWLVSVISLKPNKDL